MKKEAIATLESGRTPPNNSYLILDTGGWTIKHGLCVLPETSEATTSASVVVGSSSPIHHTPNATAQLPHQITTWVGKDLESCVKNQSLLRISRPMERGYYSDFQTQILVWEHVLDTSCYTMNRSSSSSDINQSLDTNHYKLNHHHAFANKEISTLAHSNKVLSKANTAAPAHTIQALPTHQSTVVLLSKPHVPRCLLEHEDEIWFQNFGFGTVIRRLSASCSAYKYLFSTSISNPSIPWVHDETGCCCVVESGFSLTHIVPTVHTFAMEKAIRRINIGGKHLTNLLKEIISYRHWNMMDEFAIVNQVKEALCFIQEDGKMEALLKYAKRKPLGSRWFDREFVLPDFVHSMKGIVQLPRALAMHSKNQNQREEEGKEEEHVKIQPKKRQKHVSNKNSIADENTRSDGDQEDNILEKDNNDGDDDDDDEEDIDSEDESDEAKRRRILDRKEEEKRLLQLQQEEHQILPMSVERFTVPEILFRPSDVGIHQLGLAQAIVQSIQACDPMYHAAMYHNIVLTGGNMMIPHFKQRLEVELRALVPSHYTIRIYLPEDPISYAWDGAKEWVTSGSMTDYLCLDKRTWEEMKKQQRNWGSTWKKAHVKDLPGDGFVLI